MEFNKARVVSYSTMQIEDNGSIKNLNLLEQVAYCARVSNPENQNNHLTSEKLCKYLLKHHHYSPFEMVNICVEIETTRDISRQIIRHRSFSFQEFSQRYALATNFTTRECRLQHPTNRQMSLVAGADNKELSEKFASLQQELIQKEKEYYDFCIYNNIAKEQSRVILSEGLTKTKLYMNGTLRSWIHYLNVRTNKDDTQAEHVDLALKIKEEIHKIFPLE
uniref:Thymidylate synthase n=1 Tax=viral metagenome TaxID=1070528 RepID=A0A6C0D197_9ZZZZ